MDHYIQTSHKMILPATMQQGSWYQAMAKPWPSHLPRAAGTPPGSVDLQDMTSQGTAMARKLTKAFDLQKRSEEQKS